jgi:hypothetical protein
MLTPMTRGRRFRGLKNLRRTAAGCFQISDVLIVYDFVAYLPLVDLLKRHPRVSFVPRVPCVYCDCNTVAEPQKTLLAQQMSLLDKKRAELLPD